MSENPVFSGRDITKLLVITAGTVASAVGQTIIKQMKVHPNSGLNVMVRYIDTAFLLHK